nr:hypothetical protein [Tanacetum cinerariifolium]
AVTHHHDRSTIIAPPLFFEELMTMDNSYESNIDKEALDFIKTGHERNFKDATNGAWSFWGGVVEVVEIVRNVEEWQESGEKRGRGELAGKMVEDEQ